MKNTQKNKNNRKGWGKRCWGREKGMQLVTARGFGKTRHNRRRDMAQLAVTLLNRHYIGHYELCNVFSGRFSLINSSTAKSVLQAYHPTKTWIIIATPLLWQITNTIGYPIESVLVEHRCACLAQWQQIPERRNLCPSFLWLQQSKGASANRLTPPLAII